MASLGSSTDSFSISAKIQQDLATSVPLCKSFETLSLWRSQLKEQLESKDMQIVRGNATVETLRQVVGEVQEQKQAVQLVLNAEMSKRSGIVESTDHLRGLCHGAKDQEQTLARAVNHYDSEWELIHLNRKVLDAKIKSLTAAASDIKTEYDQGSRIYQEKLVLLERNEPEVGANIQKLKEEYDISYAESKSHTDSLQRFLNTYKGLSDSATSILAETETIEKELMTVRGQGAEINTCISSVTKQHGLLESEARLLAQQIQSTTNAIEKCQQECASISTAYQNLVHKTTENWGENEIKLRGAQELLVVVSQFFADQEEMEKELKEADMRSAELNSWILDQEILKKELNEELSKRQKDDLEEDIRQKEIELAEESQKALELEEQRQRNLATEERQKEIEMAEKRQKEFEIAEKRKNELEMAEKRKKDAELAQLKAQQEETKTQQARNKKERQENFVATGAVSAKPGMPLPTSPLKPYLSGSALVESTRKRTTEDYDDYDVDQLSMVSESSDDSNVSYHLPIKRGRNQPQLTMDILKLNLRSSDPPAPTRAIRERRLSTLDDF